MYNFICMYRRVDIFNSASLKLQHIYISLYRVVSTRFSNNECGLINDDGHDDADRNEHGSCGIPLFLSPWTGRSRKHAGPPRGPSTARELRHSTRADKYEHGS